MSVSKSIGLWFPTPLSYRDRERDLGLPQVLFLCTAARMHAGHSSYFLVLSSRDIGKSLPTFCTNLPLYFLREKGGSDARSDGASEVCALQ